jgi:hypothetical protein
MQFRVEQLFWGHCVLGGLGWSRPNGLNHIYNECEYSDNYVTP